MKKDELAPFQAIGPRRVTCIALAGTKSKGVITLTMDIHFGKRGLGRVSVRMA